MDFIFPESILQGRKRKILYDYIYDDYMMTIYDDYSIYDDYIDKIADKKAQLQTFP